MVSAEVGVILTREQFIEWWDNWVPENPVNRRDHPLWLPETEIKPGPPCQWFVKNKLTSSTSDYWKWCRTSLKGMLRCYMVDEENGWEWWGFTDKQDMTLWMLKWA